MLKVICYISSSANNISTPDLEELFHHVTTTNNNTLNISGVLIYKNENFLQIMEGEPQSVDHLYEKISVDQRHNHMIKIIDMPVSDRIFEDYQTGFTIVKSSKQLQQLEYYIDWIRESEMPFALKTISLLETFTD